MIARYHTLEDAIKEAEKTYMSARPQTTEDTITAAENECLDIERRRQYIVKKKDRNSGLCNENGWCGNTSSQRKVQLQSQRTKGVRMASQ